MTERETMGEWLARAYSEPGDCPPPEVHLAAEWQALGTEEQAAVNDHVEHCPACSAERDLATAFDSAPEEMSTSLEANLEGLLKGLPGHDQGAASGGTRRGADPSRRVLRFPSIARLFTQPTVGLAAAAMVVLAVGVVLRSMIAGPPSLPGVPIADATRGGRVEVVAPVGEIEDIPSELLWHEAEGAREYRVTVTAVDETILWTTTLVTPPAMLPTEVRSELHIAVAYFWVVEAFDDSGSRVSWSESISFTVMNPAGLEAR